MARKSLNDLSGIASTIARSGATKDRAARSSAPALGALQGSLSAIRELDPALIDDWGPVDRLEEFTAVNDDDEGGFEALKASIRDGGQQVPILVRKAREGRYEAIYGRRRLRACRDLGIKVRANVQEIDDATALLAKGLENAARRNLSFYEKARFARAIRAAGHDSATVRQVLNLSASGLSHLAKVTENVPDAVGRRIGAAPKSGRPKWTALAEAFAAGKITERAALAVLNGLDAVGSDERLDGLLQQIARRGKSPAQVHEVSPAEGVTIRAGRAATTMTIRRSDGFAGWLAQNLDQMIQDAEAEFTAVNRKR